MKEYEWFESVVKSEIRMKKVTTEIQLSGLLSDCETRQGMSAKVGDRLYKRFRKEVI